MTAISGIPGPRGKPVVGNVLAFRRDPFGFFLDMARAYGPLASFRLFHLRCCLVSEPELIRRVLVEESERLQKPWDLRQLRVALGDGLLTNEGEAWRRQRRLIQPTFRHERVETYARIMVRRTERLLDGWSDGGPLDLHAEMMRLTLGIVAESLFGADVSDEAEGIAQALHLIQERFHDMMTGVPVPLRLPTPANLRLRRAVRRLDRVVLGLIETRRASGAERDDLLSRLLASRDADGRPMSERQLRDEVVTLMLAGHETTALALAWAFSLLARHPEADAALAAELDRVLGTRPPTAADVPALAYTKQVIDESMRLYPPAWGIGREVLEPFELGGHRIPEGTQLFMVQYAVHRDPRLFPDPERFRPERWASDDVPPHRYAYFPFGGGPRLCVGMHFAVLEAVLVLACVARRFRFEPGPGGAPEPELAVTLRPRGGVPAVAHRRRVAASQRGGAP